MITRVCTRIKEPRMTYLSADPDERLESDFEDDDDPREDYDVHYRREISVGECDACGEPYKGVTTVFGAYCPPPVDLPFTCTECRNGEIRRPRR
ncbi:MAG: hypothetical protein ABH877_00655 [bacterium]